MVISSINTGINIVANLRDGITLFTQRSGVGKTYFFKLTQAFGVSENLNCYYGDYQLANLAENIIVDICKSSGSDIFILDNADLYVTDELINKLRGLTKYLLIALHNPERLKITDFYYCDIEYKDDVLKAVYTDEDFV